MDLLKIFSCVILGLTVSCADPHAEFIGKINNKIKEDAMGVELHYENIQFEWIDTLYVKEHLLELEEEFLEKLNNILNIEYYVGDNFENGKIFSLEYLTLQRFKELRNWEIEVGHPNQTSLGSNASWLKDGYKDYYEFAFANRGASKWLSELCSQIENTDKLIDNYDELQNGNLELLENIVWYYRRIDNFWTNGNPSEIWEMVADEITDLADIRLKIDSLNMLQPKQVIHYKALNTFSIKNPLLGGARQELEQYFLFNDQFKIIGREDLNE